MQHSTSENSVAAVAGGELSAPSGKSLRIAWFLIAAGILIRIALFATNRPLWLDEAQLAVNFVELDYQELARPGVLIFHQGAPVGYLLAVKLSSEIFGTGEMAMRLVALLTGIANILVFHRLAFRALPVAPALVALGLFCFSEPLIYYSNEVKPYGLDVLVSMLYCWLALRLWQEGDRWRDYIALGLVGAATVWFSMPSIFTFAGVCLMLGCRAVMRRRWVDIAGIAAVGAVFLAAYFANYARFIAEKQKTYTQMGQERFYSQDGRYMPLPPRSLTDLTWFAVTPVHYFVDPLGFRAFGLALVASLIGLSMLWRSERLLPLMLLSPLLLSLAAAAVNKYPFMVAGEQGDNFMGRLSLFTVPYAIMFMGMGLVQAWQWLRGFGRLALIGGIAALAVHPAIRIAEQFLRPPGSQEIRGPLEHLKQNHQPGDWVYLHWVAQPIYRYYASRMALPTEHLIGHTQAVVSHMITPGAWVRIPNWHQSEEELAKARGQRVWMLFAHQVGSYSYADEKHLFTVAERWGRQVSRVETRGASLTLFDLRSAPNQPDP